MKNIFKLENVMLQLMFNPGFSLTGFRTTRPKTVYSVLIKSIFSPNAESKILRYGFTQKNIYSVYELPFEIKNDIKITMFQYKIIHKILATNVNLYRAKIRITINICPQCLAGRNTFILLSNSIFLELFENW